MIVEVCDLCKKPVKDLYKTQVIIKDYKGCEIEYGFAFPAKRRFKGVICDDCLELLIDSVKKEEDAND